MAQPGSGAQGAGASGAAKARILYEKGVEAWHLGNWELARRLYLEAWHERQHFQVAVSLGHVEFKLRRYKDAAEHLSYFLKEAQGVPPADLKAAEKMRTEARGHLGELRIDVNPPGAEVLLDGAAVGKAPLKEGVFVEPGQHVVQSRLEGYGAASEYLRVNVGAERTVELRLAPLTSLGPSAQKSKQGNVMFTQTPPGWSTQRKVGLAVGVAGAVGVVVGGVFGIVTVAKCAGGEAPMCARGGALSRKANTTANVSNVAFAIGGPALIGGVVLFATAPRGKAKATDAARVNLTLGAARLSLQMEW